MSNINNKLQLKNNIVKKQENISKLGVVTNKNLAFIIIIAVSLTILEIFGQSLLRKFYLLNKEKKTDGFNYLYLPFISWIIYGICVQMLLQKEIY